MGDLDTQMARVIHWEKWIADNLDIVNPYSVEKLVESKLTELGDEDIVAILIAQDEIIEALRGGGDRKA